jgi:hypothetical protein
MCNKVQNNTVMFNNNAIKCNTQSVYSCYNSLLLRTFRRFHKFFRQFVSPTINTGLGGGGCTLFMHTLFYKLTMQSSSVLFLFVSNIPWILKTSNHLGKDYFNSKSESLFWNYPLQMLPFPSIQCCVNNREPQHTEPYIPPMVWVW